MWALCAPPSQLGRCAKLRQLLSIAVKMHSCDFFLVFFSFAQHWR